MVKKLQLTPEELFYLGKLYEGKFLNYSYIQVMEDMGNARSFKGKCKDILIEKGIINENLLGDMSFDEDIKQFLRPIYFGEFCSTVEIYDVETKTKKVINFHFENTNGLMVWMEKDNYQISSVTETELKQLVYKLMPEKYNESNPPEALEVSEDTLKRVLVFKNIQIGDTAEINVYYDFNSYLCEKDADNKINVLSPKCFWEKALNCLKGGICDGL